jgi:NAD-dependent DNA ligase
MRTYQLNSESFQPAWHFDPATFGQLKVLRFFGMDISHPLTKGKCSGIIARLFYDAANKHLWTAYVYTTCDEEHISTDLRPHDKTELARTEIPADWHPKRGPTITSEARKAREWEIENVLKDGSPFDDPLPEVSIAENTFCFTGEFDFGTRKECQAAIVAQGGTTTNQVTSKTTVLVIGNGANPNWAHGNYGNKIFDAMILKLQRRKPLIISELYWKAVLDESTVNNNVN